MSWDRLESMSRSEEFTSGVEARIADPLWMIGRQWQLGELQGDDAAQPAALRLKMRHAPLVTYEGAAGEVRPLDESTPLERIVESAPLADSGAAGIHATASAGERLRRRLARAGQRQAIELLRDRFPIDEPDERLRLSAVESAAVRVQLRHGIDGRSIAQDARGASSALRSLDAADRSTVAAIVNEWRSGEAVEAGDAWLPRRLEHSFSVVGNDRDGPVGLNAPEHHGGLVDWHTFEIDPKVDHGSEQSIPKKQRSRSTEVTMIPTPVQFAGMPASRWWEFENTEVHLGDLDAGPGDLARLAVAEFATVYNDDWFVVPVRVQRSSLVRVESLEVFDTFGGRRRIDPATQVDTDVHDGKRPFRFLELTGDPHVAEKRAPWLMIPPAVTGTMHGPPIERVILARDEDANLAWAIERTVEGPLGRPHDRASTWAGRAGAADTDSEPRRYGDEYWRYELETSPPPWWIPLVPERITNSTEEVRLRRARLASWSEENRSDVGPKGTLLEPRRPFSLFEEEVPKSGAVVERRWQWARWSDGSTHVWLQRRKRNGRGERSSGLGWDALHPEFETPEDEDAG